MMLYLHFEHFQVAQMYFLKILGVRFSTFSGGAYTDPPKGVSRRCAAQNILWA